MSYSLELLNLFGLPLVRVDGKIPVGASWNREPCSLSELQEWDKGFGVLLGGPEGLIDIEGDGPSAEEDFRLLFSGRDVPKTCSWKSARGVHRLFHLTPEQQNRLGNYGRGKVGELEIHIGHPDCYRYQCVLPGADDEREWLVGPEHIADASDSMVEQLEQVKQNKPVQNFVKEDIDPTLPGNIYNEDVEWRDILTADGWTMTGERSAGVQDWKHPNTSQPLSATVNWFGNNKLHVFTTSIEGLESGHCYTPFEYRALTKCGGDFTKCASDLVKDGYVMQSDGELFDIIPADPDDFQAPDDIPTELLLLPGFVSDFAHLHAKRVFTDDLRLGALMGIAFQSLLMGRRVKLYDGTRPNLAMMILSQSGTGKTGAIETMKLLLQGVGCTDMLHQGFSSWQSMQDQIIASPSMLYVHEEAHGLLASLSNGKESSFVTGMLHVLKEIITSSKTLYKRRTLPESSRLVGTEVDQPSLTLVLTGVSSKVWPTIRDGMTSDGFIARLWAVECNDKPKLNRHPKLDQKLFDKCQEHCRKWLSKKAHEIDPPEALQASALTTGKVDPLEVLGNDDVYDMAFDYQQRCLDLRYASDEATGSVWNRAHEQMCKLLLIIAGSRCVDNLSISVADIDLAIAINEYAIASKIHRMNTRHNVVNTDSDTWRIINYLGKRKNMKLSWRQVYRPLHMKVYDFNLAIVDAIVGGYVATDATLTGDYSRISKAGNYLRITDSGLDYLSQKV